MRVGHVRGTREDRRVFWPPGLDGRPPALLGGPDLGTCETKGTAAYLPKD